MSQLSLKSLLLACILGIFPLSSHSKPPPLQQNQDAFEMYDFEDEESTAFFGDFFMDEPGDPDKFDEYYSMARMAFLFGYYDTAQQYWQPMANLGYAKAQASIGWMYHAGKGFKQDYTQAYEWYLKAAKQNHAIAQNNIGVLYEKGWGVAQDQTEAVKWFKESAEWGYSFGQFNYGRHLRDGRGVKRDTEKSDYWLNLASLQGVKQADALLGKAVPSQLSRHIIDQSASPSDKLKKKIWIMMKNPRYYTLQVTQGNSVSELKKYIEQSSRTGPFAYFTSDKDGKKTYHLVYGIFSTYTEAEQNLKSLPPNMTKSMPWIRKFGNIQKDIKKKM